MPSNPRPLILVRGFGFFDVEDEQRNAYQGFNDGTVYPDRRGDSYIYEGFVLRALKSRRYRYTDATNVIAYYGRDMEVDDLPDPEPAHARRIVLDSRMAEACLAEGVAGTIWVYRYYDLLPRSIRLYAEGLVRLIELIEQETDKRSGASKEQWRGVDIVAHSMGGLIVNEALRLLDARQAGAARTQVNKVVTLGTPHRGIRFQAIPPGLLHALSATYEKVNDLRRLLPGRDKEPEGTKDALDELAAFDDDNLKYLDVATTFDPRRVLTIVGTDFGSYGNKAASVLNQMTNLADSGGVAGNHSDGLVMQSAAQLPGSPRTFIHKCHGGRDSLVTSREAYEIAMRFLHGTHHIALRLQDAEIKQGGDWGPFRNEFYLGVSIKPRGVDFNLFEQSMKAQNCYGPFNSDRLEDGTDVIDALQRPLTEWDHQRPYWAGPGRLLWEGWIDADNAFKDAVNGAIFRVDVFVGEDDPGGFSDKVILRKQVFIQVFPGSPPALFVHSGETYLDPEKYRDRASVEAVAQAPSTEGLTLPVQQATPCDGIGEGTGVGWDFTVNGTGFTGTFHIEVQGAQDADRP
ncbi:esterase/lipase family protein [Nocardioides plantarum]|uniref:Esterase/lipase family protein n=1 Tax=Nocardioides plantarum TaxID=29299 RepID=A0ABV5KGF6_9ACTN|nr:hypothetical protein [Nocardioides plantarum]